MISESAEDDGAAGHRIQCIVSRSIGFSGYPVSSSSQAGGGLRSRSQVSSTAALGRAGLQRATNLSQLEFDAKLEDERRSRAPNSDPVLVVKLGVPTAPVSADRLPVDSRSAHAAAIGEDELPLSKVDQEVLARHHVIELQDRLDQVNIIQLRCQPPVGAPSPRFGSLGPP